MIVLILPSWKSAEVEICEEMPFGKVYNFREVTQVTFYEECIDEYVTYTGNWHLKLTVTEDKNGGLHVNRHWNTSQTRGVGQTSGTVWKGGGHDMHKLILKKGVVHTDQYHETYHAPHQPDLTFYFKYHITVNANGEISVERGDSKLVCG